MDMENQRVRAVARQFAFRGVALQGRFGRSVSEPYLICA
ncbi:hypothetical protein CSIRO_2311 [Bradyrhizobiaceae bacterium SG-6C]|nr:hypothetical protein CSIRO_2311 [Bradyrhizobiaceae bacterium SG-6C]